MTAYKRIAVLMGGRSAEREVSLSSGQGVMKALAEEGFEPISVDPGDNPGDQLFRAKPDAVSNALHGRFGEDGTVQGLLELMRLPYTHSGVLASALWPCTRSALRTFTARQACRWCVPSWRTAAKPPPSI